MTKREKILALLLVLIVVGAVVCYLFRLKGIEINAKDGVGLLVAIGTVGMTLMLVYLEIFKFWIRKPEIKIEFKDKDPYCRYEKEKEEGKGPGPYWCHFVVVNNGGRQADDCEAVLEKIWDPKKGEKDRSKWPERKSWIPVNLKWSTEKFFRRKYYKTIYPGGRRYFCDIGRVNKKTDGKPDNDENFAFELSGTFISQDIFLKPGSYEIQISVYSKNAAKVTKKFRIDWCGGWKGTQKEMQKRLEIKIKRCCRVWKRGRKEKNEE